MMEKVFSLIFCLVAMMFGAVAWAQVVPEPTVADWVKLLQSLGGLKGAGALAIAAAIVQILMYLMRSKLGNYAGKHRLIAVYLLTMVSGVLTMVVAGADWVAAIIHSNNLAALQVLAHQVYKNFAEKPALVETPKVT